MMSMTLRLILCQMVLGFSLVLDPANPQHGFGLAIICFGATGLINNTVGLLKSLKNSGKDSNEPI